VANRDKISVSGSTLATNVAVVVLVWYSRDV